MLWRHQTVRVAMRRQDPTKVVRAAKGHHRQRTSRQLGCIAEHRITPHLPTEHSLELVSEVWKVGVIDSQSVNTKEGGGIRGLDSGKKVNGRKRHTVVDTIGMPALSTGEFQIIVAEGCVAMPRMRAVSAL